MNKTNTEATKLAQQLAYGYLDNYSSVDVVVCPPFTALRSVQVTLGFDSPQIKLGAQDVYWQPEGAYTGAVSVSMLADLGCAYCIVGHSERRSYFGETDADVNRKAQALLSAGIAPILCCGESLEIHEQRTAVDFVAQQLRSALVQIDAAAAERLVIAYEPIWAIGTGITPTPEQADEVASALREVLAELYGYAVADDTRILYGGSVNIGNVGLFSAMPNIDGGLIGAASLTATDFLELVKAFA
jgi:triosephosphate isomerase